MHNSSLNTDAQRKNSRFAARAGLRLARRKKTKSMNLHIPELFRRRCLTGSATVIAMFMAMPLAAQMPPQKHVHQMSHSVMPFDISKTVHIFKMTDFGGVERVVSRDPKATDQIALIQQHLKHETAQFQGGDYSDPARLHGETMPGLKELRDGASRLKVKYAALPDGAEITFESSDFHLVTAVHRWFGAQLSEHGSDARAE